jgi:ABC-type multidrug transport system permease subunit
LSIVYWVIGYQSGYERFGMAYLALMLVAQTGAGIGLMISAQAPNINQATAIAPLLLLPLTLFGGLFVNPDTTFVWLSWIQWISPVRYGFECFCITEWGNTPNKLIYEVLLGFGTRVGYWDCIIALASLALGFRIISIIALKLNI